MSIKVKMLPHLSHMGNSEGGVNTVIRKYFQYLPAYDIELVDVEATSFDIMAIHAGASVRVNENGPTVSHLHGLYFAGRALGRAEEAANGRIVHVMRHSKAVTVPSQWVADIIAREARIRPYVVPHGVSIAEWRTDGSYDDYIIGYAKNRVGDVCNPKESFALANAFPSLRFLMTYASRESRITPNVKLTGTLSYEDMKAAVKRAAVFISPIKETWGLAAVEALAAGVPVLTCDEGNVPEFIQHGVNGYCYRPGDLDDMAKGLQFCLDNRKQLGQNAAYLAGEYDWEQSIKKLVVVYKDAVQPDDGAASVIIPVYKKTPQQVARAISSALNQTLPPREIIVVNDNGLNSEGNLQAETLSLVEANQANIKWIDHERNLGVAHARNSGVRAATTQYVCCLDADDAIKPHFLEACVEKLNQDSSVGVAYTRLQWIKPDGSTGVSDWPGAWDYDAFLKKRNQVPTCCVYRKEMWERLGGYRQRYAPTGAGAEDAEFFLRAGAYGFKGALASEAPLFVYSWMSGHTSRPEYREADWLGWHPNWTSGHKHPVVSYAKPKNNLAHPVLEYDRPDVSIVIPLGPRHSETIVDALDSLEAQTSLMWEAIVVVNNEALYHAGQMTNKADELVKAYPYVRWIWQEPGIGAGAARNIGARAAHGAMLLFLDADDYLHPTFLAQTLALYTGTESGIYTDYFGEAYVEDESKLSPNLQNNIVKRQDKLLTMRYRASDFDCLRALRQPPKDNNPYLWGNITTLIPLAWHFEVGGFDETLESWEDVDYWWRMAKSGHCFERLPEPLMLYRFHTGNRREDGLKAHDNLLDLLREQHKKLEISDMGCGCSKKQANVSPSDQLAAAMVAGRPQENAMADDSFILVKYLHGNKGQHFVRGAATRTAYGYRAGGTSFLVHKDDVAAQPHLFIPIQDRAPIAPPPPRREEPKPVQDIVAKPFTVSTPTLGVVEAVKRKVLPPFEVMSIQGIGPALRDRLSQAGLDTPEKIIEAGMDGLMKIQSMRSDAANRLLEYAAHYVL